MRKSIFCLALAVASMGAQAADERDASLLVKKYSETVACGLEGSEELNENQYKAVMVKPGFADLGGMGAVFVVTWSGDTGCYGGNGSAVQNFTVVEHSGYSSADPVVKLDYKFPELPLAGLTSMSGGDGLLVINGVTYGDSDRQHQPTKVVNYTLKLVENEFVMQ